MKSSPFKNTFKPSSKSYLTALVSNLSYVELLSLKGKPYEKLAQWLIKNENEYETAYLPSIREIAKSLDTNDQKIARQVKAIYKDIIELNNFTPEKFVKEGQHLCYISFDMMNDNAFFGLGLEVIPRAGESFFFNFMLPVLDSERFTVKNVSYEIDNGKLWINVYMRSENPNLYLQLLKEKAFLRGDISWEDYLSNTDPDMESRILKLYDNL